VPTIISKIQDRQNIARWKKAYSNIANAFYAVKADGIQVCANHGFIHDRTNCTNGGADTPASLNVGYFTPEFVKSFLSKFKVISSCEASAASWGSEYKIDEYTCDNKYFTNLTYYELGTKAALHYQSYKAQKVLLEDGTNLYFGEAGGMPYILSDVNGLKQGPNTVGKDLFGVAVKEDRVIPIGAEGSTGVNMQKDFFDKQSCSPNSPPNSGLLTFMGAVGAKCSYEYLSK